MQITYAPLRRRAAPIPHARHVEDNGHGYHPQPLYRLVAEALRCVRDYAAVHSQEGEPLLTVDDIAQFAVISPHAFEHTFGTLAVEGGMPLVVVQEIWAIRARRRHSFT
jgi:integrase